MRSRLDPVVDGVNQADFGASFIYWKKNWKPHAFDGWAHAQMGRALVSLYSGTRDARVLDALVKVYADYHTDGMEQLEAVGKYAVNGLDNVDPMMETYLLSGDRRILDNATAAIANNAAVVKNWAAGEFKTTHTAIFYEENRAPAVMYPWTGDATLLQASKNAFRSVDRNHMLPYGLASGEEYVAGVGAGRKTETCDIAYMLSSTTWLYRIEGDGDWGDRMEKVFFNAAPSAVSRDFNAAAYYQTPNRIKLGELPQESTDPGEGGIAFGPLACSHVLCCIGACNRILPYFIGNMWMATDDNGLAATLYGPCTVNALAGDHVPVKIASTTDYPFNETVYMTVEPERSAAFPLCLRIPGWCSAPRITVNGEKVDALSVPGKKGFVRLARTWKKGDAVTLTLPMSVNVVRSWEGPYPKALRGYFSKIPDTMFTPRALPYACVDYGPLLFCLPIPEIDDNTPVDEARFQYALDLNPSDAVTLRATRTAMPAHWDWPYDAPLSLEVPLRPFDWKPIATQALPDAPVEGGPQETVKLVPYGCTKFRISMFPVTPRAWQGQPAATSTTREP
jgi:DUF1680 family protein